MFHILGHADMYEFNKVSIGPAILMIALLAAGCEDSTSSDNWSSSVAAPAHFRFRRASGPTIMLPAPQKDFVQFVVASGGTFYITGEGEARELSAPPPLPGSPCHVGARAVVVSFPIENRSVAPGYYAFVNDTGMVDCVEQHFDYAAP